MKNFVLKPTAAIALAAAILTPVQAAADGYKRVPDIPARAQEQPFAEALDEALGRHSRNEKNSDPIEPMGFVSDEAASRFMPLNTPKAPESIIEKARKAKAFRTTRAQAQDYIGNVYGVVNYFDGITSGNNYAKSFWGKIDFQKGSISRIFSGAVFCNTSDYEHQSGAIRDGILYIPEGRQSSVREFDVLWKRVDINTGEELSPLEFGADATMWAQALCYDPVSDTFVGMAGNADGASGSIVLNRIVRYNPAKNMEPVIISDQPTGVGQIYSGFFYNPADKQVYAYREDGRIDIIGREDGSFTPSAQVAIDDPDDDRILLAPFNDRGSVPLVYSPKDQLLYTTGTDFQNGGEVYLYFIDLEAGGYAERICRLENDTRLAYLYCPDAFALPEAAGDPVIKSFNLVKDALSGSFTFTAPDTYYNNLKLDKNVTAIATVDGKEVLRRELAPGAEASAEFTVAEGIHMLEIRCDVAADLPGPTLSRRFYAGNDTPKAPKNVEINDNVITWTAPGEAGANNGYVDVADLTYDVYFDGVQHNTTPIKGTSYTFEKPASLRVVSIEVTAKAHSKVSDKSEALPAIIGNALSLPYSCTPTSQEARLFTAIDGNGDGSTFTYDSQEQCFVSSTESYGNADDWLITPRLNFPDASAMYKIDAVFMHQTPYYGVADLDIYAGKDPEHLDIKIASYPSISVSDYEFPISLMFSLPEGGEYYIGFRDKTGSNASGTKLFSIGVEKVNSSTAVPALITAASVSAAAEGASAADIEVTIPSKDAAGNDLPASKSVTVNVENTHPNNDYVNSASGRPGETVKLTCQADKGYNTFRIFASNEEGEGPSTILRAYIGLDTPKAPENVKTVVAEDNMTMLISWDPVTEGINGGFIDPSTVSYQVWNNSQGVTWTRIGDPVAETTVNFDPNYPTLARWKLAVLAQNRDGDFYKASRLNYFTEQLGTPISLPLLEDFAYTGLKYQWSYDRDTPATEYSSFSTHTTADLATLGIGNPTSTDGSCRVLSSMIYGQATEAHLYVPKFSTENMNNPTFLMSIWNYPNAPSYQIYARTFGSETPELIAEGDPSEYDNFTWRDVIVPIPEKYKNRKWVQFQIHFKLPAAGNARGIIDKIQVYENADYDYKIDNVTGPESTTAGETAEFRVTATNGGLENGSASVRVSLYGDGQYIDCREYDMPNLRSFRSLTRIVQFPALTEYTKYDKLEVRAVITGDNDAVATNNEGSHSWKVIKKNVPTVDDLHGEWNAEHNTTSLAWSMPDIEYGNHEDFEALPAFSVADKLGQWKNYDEDGYPTFAVSGLGESWPLAGEPKAWQVVDAEALGTMNDATLCPHSGKKYLAAFAGYDPDQEKQVQVADWLISPQVVGGTEVSLWLNHISKDYRETIHVMVSSTDDKPESFTKLRNLSKQGSEEWEHASFTLPADTKYFALKYVGWDTLGMLVDDIEFTPVDIANWSIEGFDIYRQLYGEDSFTKVATTNDLSYVDENIGDNNVMYYIVVRSRFNDMLASSPRSNVLRLYSLGVDDIAVLEGVSADTGVIIFKGLDGKKASVYGTDGKLCRTVDIRGAEFRSSIEPGIYIVKIGEIAAKLIVK